MKSRQRGWRPLFSVLLLAVPSEPASVPRSHRTGGRSAEVSPKRRSPPTGTVRATPTHGPRGRQVVRGATRGGSGDAQGRNPPAAPTGRTPSRYSTPPANRRGPAERRARPAAESRTRATRRRRRRRRRARPVPRRACFQRYLCLELSRESPPRRHCVPSSEPLPNRVYHDKFARPVKGGFISWKPGHPAPSRAGQLRPVSRRREGAARD